MINRRADDRRTDHSLYRYASRFMLPLEIFMAPVLLTAGLSMGGVLGSGRLYEAVLLYGSPAACLVLLVGLAICKFTVALRELLIGRRWTYPNLFASVSARAVMAFLSMPLWAYVIYLLWSTPHAGAASPFVVIAPVCLIGNLWAYHQNYMVRCLLNPVLSTWRLECKLMAERHEIAR